MTAKLVAERLKNVGRADKKRGFRELLSEHTACSSIQFSGYHSSASSILVSPMLLSTATDVKLNPTTP